MSHALAVFPDGEDVLMALLSQVAETCQTTPEDWPADGTPPRPVIQVRQTGGTSGRIDTRPVIEVACFAPTYAEAKRMAAECEQLVLGARGKTVPDVPGHPHGVLLDKTEVVQVPRELGYRDPEKRRKTATYRLIMRRARG